MILPHRTFSNDYKALLGAQVVGPATCSGSLNVHDTLKTLNAGFRLDGGIDYRPDSGRVVLRCHSAKALLALPPRKSLYK